MPFIMHSNIIHNINHHLCDRLKYTTPMTNAALVQALKKKYLCISPDNSSGRPVRNWPESLLKEIHIAGEMNQEQMERLVAELVSAEVPPRGSLEQTWKHGDTCSWMAGFYIALYQDNQVPSDRRSFFPANQREWDPWTNPALPTFTSTDNETEEDNGSSPEDDEESPSSGKKRKATKAKAKPAKRTKK